MKKILMYIMALSLILACTACGNSTGDETDGQITLSVGGWPSQEGAKLDNMNNLKSTFETENPGVTIEPDTWTFDLKTFYPKAEAGMLPDLFEAHFTEFQKLTDGDYVEDITKPMKEVGFYENLNPRLKDLVTVDGKIYAMPTNAYALGLHCHIGLFEKAGLMNADGTPKQPKDWYELAEMAKTIKEKTGTPGFVFQTSNNAGGWIFSNIAWSFGVKFMEQDKDGKWKATFDSPEAVEALQFIKDLKWKYNCVPANTNIDTGEARKVYATGGAAMVLDGPITKVGQYEMNVNDFGLMAIPAGPKKHVALLGGTIKTVAKGIGKEKALTALKWIAFTGTDYSINDEQIKNRKESFQRTINEGGIIGVKELSLWSGESENTKNRNELIDSMCNINPNHVKLYNESLLNSDIEFQSEEPICAQDLYATLDNIIQEVYINKNADCAALIKQANSDFQKNYLDKLDY